MQKIIPIHLSSKGQITIPKEARNILHIKDKGDLLGIIIEPETRSVRLTKLNIITAEEEFSEEEYQKLLKLANSPRKKTFKTTEKAIQYHKNLIKR